MSRDRERCPFPPCRADVDIIGQTNGTFLVARHPLDAEVWWQGPCPASLTKWPLTQAAKYLLAEHHTMYRKHLNRTTTEGK